MTLESIEKLRSYAMVIEWATDDARNMWTEAVDSVEHEIERDYMKLPVDAEGVPIHVGDLIEYRCIEGTYRLHAQGVYVYREGRCEGKKCVMNERLGIWFPELCYHVKERTIESVLRDMLDAYDSGEHGEMPYSLIADYADELRELMEVGK